MKTENFIIFTLSVFIGSVIFYSCADDISAPQDGKYTPLQLTKEESDVLSASERFGLNIFKAINALEREKNLFISPLSISYALGMTLNGASGTTYDAIQGTLTLNGLTLDEINKSYKNLTLQLMTIDPKVKFQIANSIWYRLGYTFEEDFLQRNTEYFFAEVRGLDFSDPASVNIINDWVNNKTNGKIPTVIQEINPLTVMFLINALYFKGVWQTEFNKENTLDEPFYPGNGSHIMCKKMIQKSTYSYLETEKFQAVDLPYGQGNFSMTVFLPKPDQNIDDLIGELSEGEYRDWIGSFTEKEITLKMPRFKTEYETELSTVLSALGMGIAFTDMADFTAMFRPGGLLISKVIHKTFVEVNEEGTEAAAVTVVVIDLSSIGDENTMDINRPFFFVIREKESGSFLFMGKIVNPAP